MDVPALLQVFSDLMEREGIRYAVIGGLAMNAWGSPRPTKDVDIVVDAADRNRVIALVESQGFETFHVSEGYSNHERGSDRLDFMYVDALTAEQLFSTAEQRVVLGNISAPVVRPEHLAAMKAIAIKWAPRRGWRDVDDVLFLLRLPNVDREFIREYFVRKGLLETFNEIEKRL
jgi:nucleotidyltransferase AbiEii toxin of type IV toxin-antitoxin system